jgi:non-heme chloroperoxidase
MVVLDHGIVLSCRQRGDADDSAVVFVPGPTDAWRSYGPVLAAADTPLRLVAVSMRGHGESSKPATGYGIEDLASDVVPLLDALGIARAVLVGHSGSWARRGWCPV